jgi:hypothetical protein
MKSVNPSLKNHQIEEIIKKTAFFLDTISYNEPYAGKLGAGRIDAYCACYQSDPLVIWNETILTNADYKRYFIKMSNVEIRSTANVQIKAEEVLIQDEFELQAGSSFTISTPDKYSCP